MRVFWVVDNQAGIGECRVYVGRMLVCRIYCDAVNCMIERVVEFTVVSIY
jgi:hypothetical protein